MSSITILDPLTMPLVGQHLIEASAGTGKTWTLSALYVRLILAHGDIADVGRPLLPPDILVVTFTEAATAELRERIRQRCDEAAAVFSGRISGDAFLQKLIASYPQSQHDACARRLSLAVQWMDEAAIMTIHGWSHRMLHQHAFDSMSLFDLKALEDNSELLALSAKDYWRQTFYALNTNELLAVQSVFQTPDALMATVKQEMMKRARKPEQVSVSHTSEMSQLLAPWCVWHEAYEQHLQVAKMQWKNGARAVLEDYWQYLKASSHQPEHLSEIDRWAHSSQKTLPNKLELYATGNLKPKSKSPDVPQHPAFDAFATIFTLLKNKPDIRAAMIEHATLGVISHYRRRKDQLGVFDFQDLLTQLYHALQSPIRGERLAMRIRQQYPIALVDEFQDTDPWQYGAFRCIYGQQANTALLMVGDPKQAIYRFRGADIHTYLSAKRETPSQFMLDTNYRSTQAVVAAVNGLFDDAVNQDLGAFAMKTDSDDPIPFVSVHAKGRNDTVLVDNHPIAALSICALNEGESSSQSEYLSQMSQACSNRISSLLNAGVQHRAQIVKGTAVERDLQPQDIAILVRNHIEADAVRSALTQRQIRSVYLSDRSNVFSTREALDLWRWLLAVASPDNINLLKSAMVTKTYALTPSEMLLAFANEDDSSWDTHVERFRLLRQTWQTQGVLAMLYRFMQLRSLSQYWLAQPDGERRLTNVLHIAELLQTASLHCEGEHALIRWLENQIQHGSDNNKQQQLRLETDAALVKVITIHKSKGLEYPLVFIPFVLSFKEEQETEEGSDTDRLQEDLRLLYVALTRAQHALWLGVAGLKKGNRQDNQLHKTALGYLLTGLDPVDNAQWHVAFKSRAIDYTSWCSDSPPPLIAYQTVAQQAQTKSANTRQQHVWPMWRMSSYSSITHHQAYVAVAYHDSVQQEEIHHNQIVSPVQPSVQSGLFAPWQEVAGSATLGTMLHDLLEWLSLHHWQLEDSLEWQHVFDQQLAKHKLHAIDSHLMVSWLTHIIHQPLWFGERAPCLSHIKRSSLWPEMSFYLPLAQLRASMLDQHIRRMFFSDAPRPALEDHRLGGMLKGFMDLVFEHHGKFYILDYKSNRLDAYDDVALKESVLGARYDVQAALYLVALHRLLRVRLPNYCIEQHLGGALYLYVRGVGQAMQPPIWWAQPDPATILALDHLLQVGI